MQRFELEDWGVLPMLHPQAMLAHSPPPKTETVQPLYATDGLTQWAWKAGRRGMDCCLDLKVKEISTHYRGDKVPSKIDVSLSHPLSARAHAISGRAGSVFAASAEGFDDMVCKIYNPEVARQNEGLILQEIYKLIDEKKLFWIKDHLPTMLFCGDIVGCSTNRIRSMIGIDWMGDRTMRFILFKKLRELTELTGKDFVKAWFDVVICHGILWELGVQHGDPSLWNSMCAPETNKGVLSDFDLAIIQKMPRRPEHERTGTIPFMAVDLLNDAYWHISRQYRHELEALIWVLPFVFLRYPTGHLLTGTDVDKWMTSDYTLCRKEKSDFWDAGRLVKLYQKVRGGDDNNWKEEWRIAYTLLKAAREEHTHQAEKQIKTEELGGALSAMVSPTGKQDETTSVRIAFINTCRQLVDQFPYISEYLDKFQCLDSQ